MAEIQNMLALKKNLNKKRPQFIRQEYRIRRKLRHEVKWRLPRGKHSKMREGRVGKVKRVQAGYRSPAMVRGLTLTGIRPVIVHNLEELQKLNAKTDIAIFSSTVGLRARAEMFRKAQQMGIKTNVRQDRLDARLAEMKKRSQAKPEQKTEKPVQAAQPAAGKKNENLLEKIGEPANTAQPKTEAAQAKPKGKKVTGK